ncbi:MAG: FHA domain-containing protein [Thermaurantimonas sp.]
MTDKPIRCPNCGYANEPKNHRCKRCNYPLREEDAIGTEESLKSAPVNATIVGLAAQIDPWDMDNSKPVSQQIPLNQPVQSKSEPVQSNFQDRSPSGKREHAPVHSPKKLEVNKTIDPTRISLFETHSLKLVRLPKDGEKEVTLEFEGESVILNRSNTDPGNMTITSREQALLEHIDGEWKLSDRSELHTTYVRVDHPVTLKNGDVILLGNRAFRVEL